MKTTPGGWPHRTGHVGNLRGSIRTAEPNVSRERAHAAFLQVRSTLRGALGTFPARGPSRVDGHTSVRPCRPDVSDSLRDLLEFYTVLANDPAAMKGRNDTPRPARRRRPPGSCGHPRLATHAREPVALTGAADSDDPSTASTHRLVAPLSCVQPQTVVASPPTTRRTSTIWWWNATEPATARARPPFWTTPPPTPRRPSTTGTSTPSQRWRTSRRAASGPSCPGGPSSPC